jgi:2-amino-4-hydroxy-6-hydroxymethyldihydropteridine diphosphokinase
MAVVYLGLGSNLGNRKNNIQKALKHLRANKILIKKLSRIIETDPVGGPPQGKFLNGVAKAATDLSPGKLLATLKKIEKVIGRKKGPKYGPRVIDIDILLYDTKKIRKPDLIIPHPQMFKRDFVMRPLQQIAPRLAKQLTS